MNQHLPPLHPPAPQICHPVTRTSGPERWIALIFASKSVRQGGIVRRNRTWVEREVGLDRFELEVRRRGFHLIEAGNQLIVLCHNGPVRFLF